MVTKIRLSKTGRKGRWLYRIVSSPARSKRDGGEVIGFYNPTTNPPTISLDKNKYDTQLKHGAQPSVGLLKILKTNK